MVMIKIIFRLMKLVSPPNNPDSDNRSLSWSWVDTGVGDEGYSPHCKASLSFTSGSNSFPLLLKVWVGGGMGDAHHPDPDAIVKCAWFGNREPLGFERILGVFFLTMMHLRGSF